MSADEMMRALLGSKHKGSMDLRANLKSVKKEDVKQDKVGPTVPSGWSTEMANLLVLMSFLTCVVNFRCLPVKLVTGVKTWRPCQAWRAARRCLTQVVLLSETVQMMRHCSGKTKQRTNIDQMQNNDHSVT